MEGHFVFNNYKYFNLAGIYLETLFANLTIVPFPAQELLAFTRDSHKRWHVYWKYLGKIFLQPQTFSEKKYSVGELNFSHSQEFLRDRAVW